MKNRGKKLLLIGILLQTGILTSTFLIEKSHRNLTTNPTKEVFSNVEDNSSPYHLIDEATSSLFREQYIQWLKDDPLSTWDVPNDFSTFTRVEIVYEVDTWCGFAPYGVESCDYRPDEANSVINLHAMTPIEIEYVHQWLEEWMSTHYIKNSTNVDQIKAFYSYVTKEYKYNKQNQTPWNLIQYQSGDCSSFSLLLDMYLEELQLPHFRMSTSLHIWNVVYIEGKWKMLDPTWDLKEFKLFKKDFDYFLVNSVKDGSPEHFYDYDMYTIQKEYANTLFTIPK